MCWISLGRFCWKVSREAVGNRGSVTGIWRQEPLAWILSPGTLQKGFVLAHAHVLGVTVALGRGETWAWIQHESSWCEHCHWSTNCTTTEFDSTVERQSIWTARESQTAISEICGSYLRNLRLCPIKSHKRMERNQRIQRIQRNNRKFKTAKQRGNSTFADTNDTIVPPGACKGSPISAKPRDTTCFLFFVWSRRHCLPSHHGFVWNTIWWNHWRMDRMDRDWWYLRWCEVLCHSSPLAGSAKLRWLAVRGSSSMFKSLQRGTQRYTESVFVKVERDFHTKYFSVTDVTELSELWCVMWMCRGWLQVHPSRQRCQHGSKGRRRVIGEVLVNRRMCTDHQMYVIWASALMLCYVPVWTVWRLDWRISSEGAQACSSCYMFD